MSARGKRSPSKVLKPEPSAPAAPPPTWREVLRRPSFRAALLRQAVPVIGVVVLGWPAVEVAIFFLLDTWLFLTARASCDIALDTKFGGSKDASPWAVAKVAPVGAVTVALFVAMFGGIPLVMALPAAEWQAMGGLRRPVFLVSFLFLAASHLYDTVGFVRRFQSRTEEERRWDALASRVVIARMFVLVVAPFGLQLASLVGMAGRALVLLISGAILWLEAFPERADRILGRAQDARSA